MIEPTEPKREGQGSMPRRPGSAPLRRVLSETQETLSRMRSGSRLETVLRNPYPKGGFGAAALAASQQRKTKQKGDDDAMPNKNGGDSTALASMRSKASSPSLKVRKRRKRPASASGPATRNILINHERGDEGLRAWRQTISNFRQRMEYARSEQRKDSTKFMRKLNNSSSSDAGASPSASPQKKNKNKNTTFEFMPGTGIIYGSQVAFRSAQRKFLAVDLKTGRCSTVDGPSKEAALSQGNVPPTNATRLYFFKALQLKDRSPVRYGDSVWLGLDPEGETFLGVKMIAQKGDRRGSHSSSLARPNAIRRKSQRGLEIARWLVVCANRGHAKVAKGEPVRHLGTVRLEIEWNCLATKSMGENQTVSVVMQPVGRMAIEANRTRRMSETGARGSASFAAAAAATAEALAMKQRKKMKTGSHKVVGQPISKQDGGAVKAVGHSSLVSDHKQFNSLHRREKQRGNQSLSAGRGTSWTIFLSELANETQDDEDKLLATERKMTARGKNRKTRGAFDRDKKAALRAQSKLLESRRKRHERGDLKWVYDIERERLERSMEGAALCVAAGNIRRGLSDGEMPDPASMLSMNVNSAGDESESIMKRGDSESEAGIASFMQARFHAASQEQFLWQNRGASWSKEENSKSSSSETFLTAGQFQSWQEHSSSKIKRHKSRSRRGLEKEASSRQDGSVIPSNRVDVTGEHRLQELEEWPSRSMSKRERAQAVAEAAKLESQIKSSMWAVVGRHQTFLNAQQEHKLTLAATALQRAIRAWLRKRWKRRFQGEDAAIDVQISQEKAEEEQALAAAKKAMHLEIDTGLAPSEIDRSDSTWTAPPQGIPPTLAPAPIIRLVPRRSLRWEYYISQPAENAKVNSEKVPETLKPRVLERQKANPAHGIFGNLLRSTPESSQLLDSEHSAPQDSEKIITTTAPVQPQPEIMDLGTTLWASTMPGVEEFVPGNKAHLKFSGGNSAAPSMSDTSGEERMRQQHDSTDEESRMTEAGILPRSNSRHLRKLRLLPPDIGILSSGMDTVAAADPPDTVGLDATGSIRVALVQSESAPTLGPSNGVTRSHSLRKSESNIIPENLSEKAIQNGMNYSSRPRSAPMKRGTHTRTWGNSGGKEGAAKGRPRYQRRKQASSSTVSHGSITTIQSQVGKAHKMLEETNRLRTSLALRHTKKLKSVRSSKSTFAAKLQMHLIHSTKYSNF